MRRHQFQSEVWQSETLTEVAIPSCNDLFPIKFQLFQVTRRCGPTRTEEEDENVTSEELEEIKLVAERQSEPLSRAQLLYLRTPDTWSICTDTLLTMGVPQDEQPAIVAKILEALSVAVPFRPICVVIKDIVTVEGKECVICHEGISGFGFNNVTHLPCSHIYHRDCYLKWQEKKSPHYLCSCPVCPYPMPSQRLPLPSFCRPPEHQNIYEEDNIDVDTLPEPSWHKGGLMKVVGRALRTLSTAPLLFVPCRRL